MELVINWQTSHEHAELLPATGQKPNLPTAHGLPALGDLVQLADGRYWVIVARQWGLTGQDYHLTLQISPVADAMPTELRLLH